MKKHKTIYLALAGLLCLSIMVSSCKKDFKEINTNPNTSEFALPEALLARALKETVEANMNRSQRVNNELMQVTLDMGDTEGKIFRYEIRTSEADYLWNAWYTQLTNFKDIYKGGEDYANNTFMGVSLICQAWIYSMLTDTYGDIPYFQANMAKEGIYQPVFDRQKDIYIDILDKLEQANQLLKTGKDIPAFSDPVYGGIAANWRKFGNSLYLRLLLRVSAKSEIDAVSKIKEIIETNPGEYPVISKNEESAILRWTGKAPYNSPFATWREGDWRAPKLTTFFVDTLVEMSDTRIQKWATLYEGEYGGVPSGYAPGESPQAKSYLPLALMSEPLLGNILNYSEVQFIIAEAAAKGWVSKSAEEAYKKGVESSFALWGFEVPSNYFTYDMVKWNENDLDKQMEFIHRQKYYALFFTDMEQWFEYRRTGHPVLQQGAGLDNGGVMPARLMYPVYVQSANSKNYKEAVAIQGPDVISTEVWWQRAND